jgi:hypothetical protein
MRRLPWLCSLVLAGACHHSSSQGSQDSPPEGGPVASAGVRPRPVMLSPSASSGSIGGGLLGMCDPTKDAAACSPDGKAHVSCANGKWITVEFCDGPRGCSGQGNNLFCDQAKVDAGASCTPRVSFPRCNDSKTLMSCNVKGKWVPLTCAAPGTCQGENSDMPAGCR